MAKKLLQQKMVMKEEDIRYRHRLLSRWGHVCIVCGHEFANIACVTREHVVPKSRRELVTFVCDGDNVAPSHYQCNQLRGDKSLIEGAMMVTAVERMMNKPAFLQWLNKQVPNRIVPPSALQPIVLPGRFPRSFELAEWLPGMV